MSADKDNMNQTPKTAPDYSNPKTMLAAIALVTLSLMAALSQLIGLVLALISGSFLALVLAFGFYVVCGTLKNALKVEQATTSRRRFPTSYLICRYSLYFASFAVALEIAPVSVAIALFAFPLVALSINAQLLPHLPLTKTASASS